MHFKTLVLISFLLTIHAFGQETHTSKKHPIDIRLEKCHLIESNQTTFGMVNCETIAREEWDLEMNRYYKLLMNTLQTDEKVKLKAAQVSWLSYRDKEMEFSAKMYYNQQGTMWRVVAAGRSCDIVRQRALELKSYYEILTFDK